MENETQDDDVMIVVEHCRYCRLPHVYPIRLTALDSDARQVMYWCPMVGAVGTLSVNDQEELEYIQNGGPVPIEDSAARLL